MDPATTRTLQLLERVVRVDSAGRNETAVARQLAAYLDTVGVPSRLIPWQPGRSSLWARIGPDSGSPVVLVSHLDAPPADPRRWTSEAGPFDGVRREGHLVGRGVIGGKGLAVAHAYVLSELSAREAELVRPVVLVSVAGGLEPDLGAAPSLIEARRELVAARAILTVGGYTLIDPGLEGRQLHWITTAEPGWARVAMTAVGDESDPATPRLAERLPTVVAQGPRARLPASTADAMRTLGRTASPLATPALRWGWLARLVTVPQWREEPFLSGLVEESVEVLELEGGRSVASAARAQAILRCRLLPGTTPGDLKARLRGLVLDPRVFFTLEHVTASVESPRPDPELWDLLVKASRRDDREQAWATGLAVQRSPAGAFRALDAPVVGFWPLPLTLDSYARIDRPNETVDLAAYMDAADRLKQLVLELSREAPRTPEAAP